MKPQRIFPRAGADPARGELWRGNGRYEVRRDGHKLWQSNFTTATCYARAYDRYQEELRHGSNGEN